MSGIWQMMRGALEDVVDWESPLQRNVGANQQLVLEEGMPLFILGVSPGIGTCSREKYHGYNILVLGLGPGDSVVVHSKAVADCQHVALIRSIRDHERPRHNHDAAWVMAERLTVTRFSDRKIVFSRPGICKPYVNT